MTLHIAAFSGLKLVHPPSEDDDMEYMLSNKYGEKVIKVRANKDFPGRETPLIANAYYTYEDSLSIWYSSYGGFSSWREQLAYYAGYPPVHTDILGLKPYTAGALECDSGPFWELINFSDCEGVIGPRVAAKLLIDFCFVQMEGALKSFSIETWIKGLEMAAKGGMLNFG